MRRLLPTLLLTVVGCSSTGDRGSTPVTSALAVRNLERGAYREMRLGAQRIELVLPSGAVDVLDAPTTRGGSQVRSDCVAAARRGEDRGHAIRIVDPAPRR
jgi:hypothetical protein